MEEGTKKLALSGAEVHRYPTLDEWFKVIPIVEPDIAELALEFGVLQKTDDPLDVISVDVRDDHELEKSLAVLVRRNFEYAVSQFAVGGTPAPIDQDVVRLAVAPVGQEQSVSLRRRQHLES